MSLVSTFLREDGGHAGGYLSALFAEEPVPLTTFVTDPAFLGNPPLSPVQFEAVRHIERVYLPETYPLMAGPPERLNGSRGDWDMSTHAYWAEPVRMVNFATLQWGKGSGKDHICRLASMRIAYLLLCLHDPRAYFAIPGQDSIHLLNVASSKDQARRAFFEPLTRAVTRGWFKARCEPWKNTVTWEKGVESISGSSDAETQEGLNLLLGVADEIDAFRSREEIERTTGVRDKEPVRSAEGILKMMRTSSITRFAATFKNVRISYPRYLGSMIQTLTRQAQHDLAMRGAASRHYVSGPLTTWDVNPRFDHVPRVSAPGTEALVPEPFLGDYQDDPVMSRSMYECAPERAAEPYYRNPVALEACVRPGAPAVSFDYTLVAAPSGHGRARYPQGLGGDTQARVWEPLWAFQPAFKPLAGVRYALHADLAVRGDRAGVAMAHVASWQDVQALVPGEQGELVSVHEARPHVVVDFALAFSADKAADPPREIQLRWARQLAFELRQRAFAVGLFSFDGWQSTDNMQILEAAGIETRLESTDRTEDHWKQLRDLAYEGRLSLPAAFPRATRVRLGAGAHADLALDVVSAEDGEDLLLAELLALSRNSRGKVDHPHGGSKDVADAVACACSGAIYLGGEETPDAETVYPAEAGFDVVALGALPMGMGGLADAAW